MTDQKVEGAAAGPDRDFPGMGASPMPAEPAKYKALARLFLAAGPSSGARIIEHGGRFELEGRPNIWMQPLNKAARIAKLRSIDRHWRETQFPGKIRRLAASLGWTGGTTSKASAHIQNWITREERLEKESTP
jgi:hypothetical protein